VWVTVASAVAQDKPAPPSPQNDTAGSKPDAADTRKPDPPPEKPFAELIKDATAIKGLFNLYRTEEKVYLELRPEQFGKTYMISLTCESGIGERGFYAAQMCGERPVVFERQGKSVRLVGKNTRFTAADTSALSRAIDRSFSARRFHAYRESPTS
jgi:hypothetical protein